MTTRLRLLPAIVSGVYLAGCGLLASMALIALFGFVHPLMDLFNHAQPVLFFSLLLAMLCTGLFVRIDVLRPLSLTIAATGFAASSVIYVPEFIDGLSNRHTTAPRGVTVYSMMTFNVFGRNEEHDALVANIMGADTDIVVLQEFNPAMRRVIQARLVAHYPHYQYCAGGVRAFVGLYSKLPFEPLSQDACSASAVSGDRTARIVVRVLPPGGEPFALATTHNDWPAPVTRQVEQFNALRDALATVSMPLIVAGDFNSTPWSYALRRFVVEAGLERHTFNLPTFPKLWYYLGDWRWTPAILPIDHVMSRGGIAVHSLERGDPSGSDHLPIILTFSVAG